MSEPDLAEILEAQSAAISAHLKDLAEISDQMFREMLVHLDELEARLKPDLCNAALPVEPNIW